MKVLWILPYLPWPTSSGGKTRQYHLLRNLSARGHRITLLVQSKQALDAQTCQALEPMLERLIVLPRRALRHPQTLAAALCAPWPLLATVNGLAPALSDRFEALLQERWDIVQIEHSYSFQPYAEGLRKCSQPFVLTEHNLESSLGGATYGRFPRWAWPFVKWDQWRCRRWERQVFNAAQRVIAVTEADAERMRALTRTPVDVVVNGVDCQAFAEVHPAPASKRVLFVGNYEYAPNVDAVQWLLDEVAPQLWRQQPEAKLAIAGHALPASWAERWPDERIEWHGFVSDLRVLQRQCAAFVAPLRHGGGSKLKVLEALAGGLPLVSTSQGVSGLDIFSREHYLLGEDARSIAGALDELLRSPQKAAQFGEAGRQYVCLNHDWERVAQALEQVYRQAQSMTVDVEATCA
ncbi:MAG TPA: glycosyltransferase family 4 protein [Comamonas sp.]|uniref:glycosyltransferase family 4 protein n=1 Tax=Comamonas halotolerans TaxID=3041496 RepID=UPI0024E0B41F|nr:glycosyltransferase family 4 protein [Comamonas sp. NoAH]